MYSAAVLAALRPDDVLGSAATFSITGGRAVERIRNGEMVPWAGYIVVEGVDTGDMRTVIAGALSWREESLPLPLMAQFVNPVGGSGHDGAMLAGNITSLTRHGDKIWATGFIDPFAPGGIDLALALDRQTMRGISVDLDAVQLAEQKTRFGVHRNIAKGRIRGATVCPFQAIVEATIELTHEEETAMVASAAGTLTARVSTPVDPVESLVASGGSSIPLAPPKSWFLKPPNPADMNHPLEISADGRLSGIIASEGTCHIAFAGRCVPVPKSRTNYAAFRTGSVVTAEGDTVRTGPIVMDTVHPDLRRQASDAMAFYAHTGCAVADVVPYDTQFGIYVAGVMRPGATPEQIRTLRASDISPDWRYINGNPRECCALVAVNNGGFKVRQALAAAAGEYVLPGDTAVALTNDDDVFALVASGGFRRWVAEHPELDELAHDHHEEDEDEDEDHDGEMGCGGSCGCGGTCGTKVGKSKAQADHMANLELSASFMEKFGPRHFRTPKVRVFRVEQFHGNHNQADHGNWAKGGPKPVAVDPGLAARHAAWKESQEKRLMEASEAWVSMPESKKRAGDKLIDNDTPGARLAAGRNKEYDKKRDVWAGPDDIPVISPKGATAGKLRGWNVVRWDGGDLTDDNVYGPGETFAPDPPSEPLWVYVDREGRRVAGASPKRRS